MGIGMYPKPSVAETQGKKCTSSHLTGPIHILIIDEYTLMLSVQFYPIPPALCHSNILIIKPFLMIYLCEFTF